MTVGFTARSIARLAAGAVASVLVAGVASAAVMTAPPPVARPAPAVAAQQALAPKIEVPPQLRPLPRPGTSAVAPVVAPAVAVQPPPSKSSPDEVLCRDPRLTGDPRPDIIDVGLMTCGILEPVRVSAISGVQLQPPILVGCSMARRFADWLDGSARSVALEQLQSRIVAVTTMGSYACRTRNNVAGGRMSEHSRGRAVDIGGFTLANGQKVTIEDDWGKGAKGRFLKRVRGQACGPFQTVLGPGSDKHHHDHLHIDISPRGGEPYCK